MNSYFNKSKELRLKEAIERMLYKSAVGFKFYRVTYSSTRVALGTNDSSKYSLPSVESHPHHKDGLIVYFDLERNDWRSFYVDEVKYYFKIEEEDFDDFKRGKLIDPSVSFNYQKYFNIE